MLRACRHTESLFMYSRMRTSKVLIVPALGLVRIQGNEWRMTALYPGRKRSSARIPIVFCEFGL